MEKETRTEHCSFAVLSDDGHCIAPCHRNKLIRPGIMVDCIGKESETTIQYADRVEVNRKLN